VNLSELALCAVEKAIACASEGVDVVHVPEVTNANYDPLTGIGASTASGVAIRAIVKDVHQSPTQAAGIEGLTETKQLIASAPQFATAPRTPDQVRLGSDRWKVVHVETKRVAGVDVVYVMDIMR